MRIVKRAGHETGAAIGGVWTAAAEKTQRKRSDGGDSGDAAKADGGSGQKKVAKRGEELKEEMDSLIDEIDDVLEENAEEFVKNYVQRGGE